MLPMSNAPNQTSTAQFVRFVSYSSWLEENRELKPQWLDARLSTRFDYTHQSNSKFDLPGGTQSRQLEFSAKLGAPSNSLRHKFYIFMSISYCAGVSPFMEMTAECANTLPTRSLSKFRDLNQKLNIRRHSGRWCPRFDKTNIWAGLSSLFFMISDRSTNLQWDRRDSVQRSCLEKSKGQGEQKSKKYWKMHFWIHFATSVWSI